jgi:outer membrane protein assembly factor BamB
MYCRCVLYVILPVTWVSGVSAAAPSRVDASSSWFQWRGPHRDGKSDEKGLLSEWPADGPPIAWKAKGLGRGFASVAVVGGKVFTMGRRDKGEYLICLDQVDGKELWATRVGDGDHSNCTPTIDGEPGHGGLAFAVGLNGDLLCADAATGREIWRKNFRRSSTAGSSFARRAPRTRWS